MYRKWSAYAKEQKIDPYQMIEVRANLLLMFGQLSKCYTTDKKSKILQTFLKNNPDILLVTIDKSKNMIFIKYLDYIQKLDEVFSDPQKFEKLSQNPLETDIKSFRALVNTMEPYVNLKTYRQIQPCDSIKKSYGVLKMHKIGHPFRPIVSSLNTVTSGAEAYIQNVFKPMISECTYSIDSIKTFKLNFLKNRDKFNESIHEIVSFDVVQLFPNINVKRVITNIIDKIYKNKKFYFKERKDENGNKIKYPPKKIFKKFVEDTILKYSAFSSLNGFFRQISGVSMGSKLSPILANIFMNIMEQTIIKKHQMNGNIITYMRYVDDIYAVILKGSRDNILKDMHTFDPNIKFTTEMMENQEISFLDTKI